MEMERKGRHDNGCRERSPAVPGVFGVQIHGGWWWGAKTLTDTSDQAVRCLSSLVPLGVGVYGRSLVLSLVLDHRHRHVLKKEQKKMCVCVGGCMHDLPLYHSLPSSN